MRSTFPWTAALCLLGGISLAASHWLIFAYAPTEAVMGPIQKIFYMHLPLSWWALVSFFIVFLSSIWFLAKKSSAADSLAKAAAEIGVLFTTLCLITGILWGRKAWGVWWTWDPRLSTALVMWFVYMGYLILEALSLSPERRRLVRAVVGIVAFVDVPLVFLSARMWRSIHPAVFGAKGGGLEPEMLTTVLCCIGAMGILWLGLLCFRTRQIRQQERLEALLFERNEFES